MATCSDFGRREGYSWSAGQSERGTSHTFRGGYSWSVGEPDRGISPLFRQRLPRAEPLYCGRRIERPIHTIAPTVTRVYPRVESYYPTYDFDTTTLHDVRPSPFFARPPLYIDSCTYRERRWSYVGFLDCSVYQGVECVPFVGSLLAVIRAVSGAFQLLIALFTLDATLAINGVSNIARGCIGFVPFAGGAVLVIYDRVIMAT